MSYLSNIYSWSYHHHHHHLSQLKTFNGYQLPLEVILFIMANRALIKLVQGYDSYLTFSHSAPPTTLLRAMWLINICVWRSGLFSLNGPIERRDVEEIHNLGLLLLSMEHPAPNTYRTNYSSLNAFLSFTTGFLHMLLPLLGTPFLRLSVRLPPTSSLLQDATEVLLSPGSLSASTATAHSTMCWLI